MAAPTNFFNLRYLGYALISKFSPGFGVIQKPLHDIYVTYLTPKGPRVPTVSRLALTDRGILLTADGKDSFYSWRDILLWEPVQWVYVLTQDKKIMSAFEPINLAHQLSQEGLFSKLDSQYKYLAQLKHEPVLAMALRRSFEAKQIEVHAFVCGSDAEAFQVAQSLCRAEQVFLEQEAKGIGCVNCSPVQVQEAPRSVRSSCSGPSGGGGGGGSGERNGKQSSRQTKGRKVEGEITLEELFRLADMALADPTENEGGTVGGATEPPFKMGESWSIKEHRGVQRSRTFSDGSTANRDPVNEETQDGRIGGGGGGGGGGVIGDQQHPANFYENVAAPKPAPQRTYENVTKNSSHDLRQPEIPSEHNQQLPVPVVERRGSGQVDQRRKSTPHDSLRAVIADSKLSAANSKRGSVLPGSEFSNSVGLGVDLDPPQETIDVDDAPLASQSKPVALVQPRKVPRYKVLPEAVPESVHLNKVSQNQGKDEPRKEQYHMGSSTDGRGYTRSVYDQENAVTPKSVTPQPPRRASNRDVEATKKLTNSELNISRKPSITERDSGKKSSVPESSNRDGGTRSGEKKKKPEREKKKEAELESLALNANFERSTINTLTTHGTNFENALGYFP